MHDSVCQCVHPTEKHRLCIHFQKMCKALGLDLDGECEHVSTEKSLAPEECGT